ncbi:MAG: FABP family protein [Actinomycetota bacterium]
MSTPQLHPAVVHLAPLLGTWSGAGAGEYPTIEAFTFTEETVFGHVGKPFLTFVQRTKGADGLPLHTEAGYLRPVGLDKVEFVITMPSGIVESLEGTIDGPTITLESVTVLTTATAKEVTATRRTYTVDDDRLDWTFAMAAMGQPMTHHLAGSLTRQPAAVQ